MNSWWWTEKLSETCRVSYQNKFVKLVHIVGFITNKFVTMQHGHANVKYIIRFNFQQFAYYYKKNFNTSHAKKVHLTLFLIYLNASVNLTGSHIIWMSFALHVTYSKFCKDGLMMAKWPKHVVIKIKYNNILLCLTETRKYCVALYILIRLCV
jgi:hypothetical protein